MIFCCESRRHSTEFLSTCQLMLIEMEYVNNIFCNKFKRNKKHLKRNRLNNIYLKCTNCVNGRKCKCNNFFTFHRPICGQVDIKCIFCENLLTFHLPFMLTFLARVLHFNSSIFSVVQKFNITLAMH